MSSNPVGGASRARRLLTGALVLSLAACGTDSTPLPVAEDRSLPPQGYAAAGMTPLDRPWTLNDFGAAVAVLMSLSQNDPRLLPRHQSKASGAVFRQLTFADALKVLDEEKVPLAERRRYAGAAMGHLARLMTVYIDATAKGKTFDTEVVEIAALILETSVKARRMARQGLAALPADDPRLPLEKEGLEQLDQRVASIVTGTINSLGDRRSYSPAVRSRLAQLLTTLVPPFYLSLPEALRKESRAKLDDFASADADAGVKTAIASLAKALDAATPEPAAPAASLAAPPSAAPQPAAPPAAAPAKAAQPKSAS